MLNPRNLKLPFWLFNFEEIVDVLFAGRPGVPEELDILAEVIPMAKGIYTQYQNSDRVGLGLKRIDPKQISDYLRVGGYASVAKVLGGMTPETMADQLEIRVRQRTLELQEHGVQMLARLLARAGTTQFKSRY